MFCTNCGAANPDDAQFCTACKKPLNAVWQSPRSELVSAAGGEEEIVYAGFWERFAALILDSLLLFIGWLGLAFLLGIVIGVASFSRNPGELQKLMPVGIIGFYGVIFLLFGAYFVLMESGERGATLGKRALKLRVVDGNGQRISKGRALGRFFAHFLSGITLYIGYLIQPFTERKQALHDMVAGTLVVKTDKSSNSMVLVLSIIGGLVAVSAGIGVLAAVTIPAYQGYVVRAKLVKAEVVGRMAAHAVQDYAAKTGKVPASLSETGVQLPALPGASAINVSPDSGEVQVVLNSSVSARIAGKALVFDPSRGSDGQIVWKCSGPGIPSRMLPPDCR